MPTVYPNCPEIEKKLSVLAMEADLFQSVVKSLSSLVPSIRERLTNLFSTDQNKDLTASILDVSKDVKQLQTHLTAFNIVNYDKTMVMTPSGFKGNLIEYMEWLTKTLPDAQVRVMHHISDLNVHLAVFITNKDAKLTSKDITFDFKDAERETKRMLDQQREYFKASQPDATRQVLTSVLSRFSDVTDLSKAMVALDRVANGVNYRAVKDEVTRLVARLESVSSQLEDMDDERLSGQAARNVAECAYIVAKQVEYLSVLRYDTEAALASGVALIEQLDRITKN